MKPINAKWLTVGCVMLSILITFTYARKMTVTYGGIEIALAAVCYCMIFANLPKLDNITSRLLIILCCMSLINGIISMDLKSVLLLSISLVLIFTVSVTELKLDERGKDFAVAYFVGLALSALAHVFTVTLEIVDGINSNTLGFFFFMVLSLGYVWFSSAKGKLLSFICLLPQIYICFVSGSRNVSLVVVLSLILLFVPKLFYKSKTSYRIIYASVLAYTVLAGEIMSVAFANEGLYSILNNFTAAFSNKDWEIITRLEFFDLIKDKFMSMPLYFQLFGEGIVDHHSHNVFYQSLFVYGIVGTIFLYVIYIRIFEMAGRLIREKNDKITLGLLIASLGIFLLNGADIFIVGTEACTVIPQVIMGMIMYRYRSVYSKAAVSVEGSALVPLGTL